MKKYESIEIEIIEVFDNDLIKTSPGVQTPVVDENDGIWDLQINK